MGQLGICPPPPSNPKKDKSEVDKSKAEKGKRADIFIDIQLVITDQSPQELRTHSEREREGGNFINISYRFQKTGFKREKCTNDFGWHTHGI